MPKCNKCDKLFPNWIIIDGKKRNLSKRKYCLECSPFGHHNTRELQDNVSEENVCKRCGKIIDNKRRRVCHSCNVNKRRENISKYIFKFMGNKCWKCGESCGEQSKYILCFHHVNPEDKRISLTTSDLARYKREDIIQELQKCVCLCHNCHNKFHYTNLITQEEILELKENFWKPDKVSIIEKDKWK